MSNPLQEFEHLRKATNVEPAVLSEPRPLSPVDAANLIQQIRSKRNPHSSPFGVLSDPEPFEQLQKSAENAIRKCKTHKPPNCECWGFARTWLWNARKRYPERSPESWYAVKIWKELEYIEEKL